MTNKVFSSLVATAVASEILDITAPDYSEDDIFIVTREDLYEGEIPEGQYQMVDDVDPNSFGAKVDQAGDWVWNTTLDVWEWTSNHTVDGYEYAKPKAIQAWDWTANKSVESYEWIKPRAINGSKIAANYTVEGFHQARNVTIQTFTALQQRAMQQEFDPEAFPEHAPLVPPSEAFAEDGFCSWRQVKLSQRVGTAPTFSDPIHYTDENEIRDVAAFAQMAYFKGSTVDHEVKCAKSRDGFKDVLTQKTWPLKTKHPVGHMKWDDVGIFVAVGYKAADVPKVVVAFTGTRIGEKVRPDQTASDIGVDILIMKGDVYDEEPDWMNARFQDAINLTSTIGFFFLSRGNFVCNIINLTFLEAAPGIRNSQGILYVVLPDHSIVGDRIENQPPSLGCGPFRLSQFRAPGRQFY